MTECQIIPFRWPVGSAADASKPPPDLKTPRRKPNSESPQIDHGNFLLRIRQITADLIAGDGPYLRKPAP
jgi:hypothetical protein